MEKDQVKTDKGGGLICQQISHLQKTDWVTDLKI